MPCNLFESQPVFRKNMSQACSAHYVLNAGFLLGLFFGREDGGDIFLLDVG